jgi:16S rRNA (guanine527-N7)-methyltransferase
VTPSIELLRAEASRLGVDVAPEVIDKLYKYLELLDKWARATNVVGTSNPEELVRFHLADSLALLPHLAGVERLVDVGSGGGFPGAVLAAARPDDLEVTALEPIHKKHAFLSALRRELGLSRFAPLAERDEVHRARPDFRPYDAAVSRATWPVPEWLPRGAILVRAGGLVVGMEGREQGELPAGATRHPYRLGERSRAIVLWRPEVAAL